MGVSDKDDERLSLLWSIGWENFLSSPPILVDFFLILFLLSFELLVPTPSLVVVFVIVSLGPVAIRIGFVFPRKRGI